LAAPSSSCGDIPMSPETQTRLATGRLGAQAECIQLGALPALFPNCFGGMKDTKAALINRLSEARGRLAHELDMLEGRKSSDGMNREAQVEDLLRQLRSTLGEIEECISALWHK